MFGVEVEAGEGAADEVAEDVRRSVWGRICTSAEEEDAHFAAGGRYDILVVPPIDE